MQRRDLAERRATGAARVARHRRTHGHLSAHGLFDSGLPELEGAAPPVELVAAGIQHRGAVVVRSLLGSDHVERLRAHLGSAVRPRVIGPASRRAGVEESEAVVDDLAAAYADAGVIEMATAYLGGRPVAAANRTVVKRNPRPTGSPGLGWHQDGAFFGGRCHALNVWTALTPCGEDRPSLGILPQRLTQVLGHRHRSYNLAQEGRRALRSLLARTPMAVPVLQPGDAILFDELTAHRTSPPGTNTAPFRDVAITWLFAPDRTPDAITPLDL